jgi:hypothetical protein
LFGTSFAGDGGFESQSAIGTEAGNWEYDFDAPETKAAEAGDWEYGYEASAGNQSDPVCSNC